MFVRYAHINFFYQFCLLYPASMTAKAPSKTTENDFSGMAPAVRVHDEKMQGDAEAIYL
jgi:hypothetical protein